ncbi:MAG TPA: thioredoxin-like domain-containing protein [Pirellulales bacterium]|jgi:thiol-disulfide isomerase/thioredoxin
MPTAVARRVICGFAALSLAGLASRPAQAAVTVEAAMKLAPIQKDVEFDTPTKEELERCTIKAEKVGGQTGWVVRDGGGQILRRFVDTNTDNTVDQWSYFQDGLEVYRDVDSDFNGKPDQTRWFNTAGVRWGLDTNEDGRIDRWKEISAEEVSAEVVRAMADKDVARFNRLLITPEELRGLGLSENRQKDLEAKSAGASEEFRKQAASEKSVAPGGRWIQFGASHPGLIPSGTDGSTKDLVVYENGVAMVESGGKHDQLQLGTMIRVGDTWRLIGPPGEVGYFFTARVADRENNSDGGSAAGGPPTGLLAEIEALDKAIALTSNPQEQANLTAKKADAMMKIAEAVTSTEDRNQWIKQMADMISATVQSGIWPEGVDRLKKLYTELAKDQATEELSSYVEFRYLTADYGAALARNEEFQAVQAKWLKSLEKFVTDHPKSADTAEAMLQLAIAHEFAGQENDAKKWYAQIRDNFPDSSSSKKAAGAVVRLDSVGKPIKLKGPSSTPGAKSIDLAAYAGKVVLIQYWATWCEPAKVDLAQLKELHAQFGKDGFALIGVSLDAKAEELSDYLKKNRLPWAQIYEPGALDSRLANELGILTLPTMILVGKDGRVVNRNVHITELEREVGNLLKK